MRTLALIISSMFPYFLRPPFHDQSPSPAVAHPKLVHAESIPCQAECHTLLQLTLEHMGVGAQMKIHK